MTSASNLTIMVLGGSGMLGHIVARHSVRAGHRTIATIRGVSAAGSLTDHFLAGVDVIAGIDVSDVDRLKTRIVEINPDVIINCIGMIKQKPGSEDAAALITLNSLLPHQLARIAETTRSRIIHVSTDCVYSGKSGNYSEAELPDPPDLYGRSKLLGEIDAPHLTLRTSLIGWQIQGDESLLNWFMRQRSGTIKGYTKAIFSGLTCDAFSEVLMKLIANQAELTGIWHVASEPISKFDLLSRLNRRLGEPVEIEANSEFELNRSLNGKAFSEFTKIEIPSWDLMLDEVALRRSEYDDYG